jgi:hypothetical protein
MHSCWTLSGSEEQITISILETSAVKVEVECWGLVVEALSSGSTDLVCASSRVDTCERGLWNIYLNIF